MSPQTTSSVTSVVLIVIGGLLTTLVTRGIITQDQATELASALAAIIVTGIGAGIVYWKQKQHSPSALTAAVNSDAAPKVKVVPETADIPAVNLTDDGRIVPAAVLPKI